MIKACFPPLKVTQNTEKPQIESMFGKNPKPPHNGMRRLADLHAAKQFLENSQKFRTESRTT